MGRKKADRKNKRSPGEPQRAMEGFDVFRVANGHFVNRAVMTLRDAEHWVTAAYGAELRELCVSKTEDGWLVRIKANYAGKKRVAWINAPSLAAGIIYAGLGLDEKSLRWKPDKYKR